MCHGSAKEGRQDGGVARRWSAGTPTLLGSHLAVCTVGQLYRVPQVKEDLAVFQGRGTACFWARLGACPGLAREAFQNTQGSRAVCSGSSCAVQAACVG